MCVCVCFGNAEKRLPMCSTVTFGRNVPNTPIVVCSYSRVLCSRITNAIITIYVYVSSAAVQYALFVSAPVTVP